MGLIVPAQGGSGLPSPLTAASFNGDLTGPTDQASGTGAGAAFTNQPNNDGVTVVSDNAGDTATVTIIGTTTGTDTVVVEPIVLNGVVPVNSAKVNWGQILAVKKTATTGTVTVSETSGGLAIVAMFGIDELAGVTVMGGSGEDAWNRTVYLNSDGATTRQVGIKGTDSAGATIYDSQALTGTTPVLSNSAFVVVTELYIGDLEAARTLTITTRGGIKIDGGFAVGNSSDTSVDNSMARFDGTTGQLVQGSPNTVDDTTGTITIPAAGQVSWADVGVGRSEGGVLKVTNGSSGVGKLLALFRVSPKTTSPVSVFALDSRTVYTNEGAGGPITFNLPAAAAGYAYIFAVQAAQNMVITAAAGDTIRSAAAVSSAGGTATNGTIGSVLHLICLNGTEWFALAAQGVWIYA